MPKVTPDAVESARRVLARRKWHVPKGDAITERHLSEAIQAAFDAMPEKVRTKRVEERIGRLYREYGAPPPGEGTHPLQGHRDSMG